MDILTKYHGNIEFDEKDIIYFRKGIPGFEDLKKYILFELKDNPLFKILHSVEDGEVGLIVTSPFEIINSYEFKLQDSIISELKLNSPEEVLVLNTVTLNSKVSEITVNLKAPIIININHKLGEQIILDDDRYSIKHPLIKE